MKPQTARNTDHPTISNFVCGQRPKPGFKQENLLRLVSRKNGSRIIQLEKELGWQSHTVRAAICGLRKLGIEIDTGKTKSGQTIYRLITADDKTGADK